MVAKINEAILQDVAKRLRKKQRWEDIAAATHVSRETIRKVSNNLKNTGLKLMPPGKRRGTPDKRRVKVLELLLSEKLSPLQEIIDSTGSNARKIAKIADEISAIMEMLSTKGQQSVKTVRQKTGSTTYTIKQVIIVARKHGKKPFIPPSVEALLARTQKTIPAPVRQEITERLTKGDYADKRALARQAGVNIKTVDRVIAQMQAAGQIVTKPKKNKDAVELKTPETPKKRGRKPHTPGLDK